MSLANASRAALLLVLLTATAARAATWTEIGDAGNLPASAQVTSGSGTLTSIQGTFLGNTDEDVYCIHVTDTNNFRAWLNCAAFADDDIWLFDVNGVGVSMDDGCQGGQTEVGLPLPIPVGTYFLAVSPNQD